MIDKIDEFYMNEALKEAEKAFSEGEVPIGAIIVYDSRIIARAHNQTEMLKDATAHAEMIAITQASGSLGDWRLNNAVIYVTKEPCPMCAGAMVNSRIKRLVFGISDIEMGAAGGAINIAGNSILRHQLEIKGGVKEKESKDILHKFFSRLRGGVAESGLKRPARNGIPE